MLDTTLVSALMRGEPAASTRLLRERPVDVVVPQPAVAEVTYGLERLPPSRRRRDLEVRLATLLAAVARSPWTDEVSQRFGEIKADLERRGKRVDDFDVAIAAHALAGEAVLVTRNLRHFAEVRGLVVDDWS